MTPLLVALCSALRDAEGFDAARARAYSRILCGTTLLVVVAWIALNRGGLDTQGKPVGADFVSFWTASQLALAGGTGLPWNTAAHWAAQKALFGDAVGYAAFFYPPPYLMLCLPLAMLPYFWSLALWLAATGFAFWSVARAWLPELNPVVFLAFPAVLVNAAHGQNGFLSAALIGEGLLVLDRRPLVAGLCFGAMVVKPQLALVLPFALIFSRRRGTLVVAAATAAALCAVSYVVFGAPAWTGFLRDGGFARAALERNLIGDEKMQSVFAAARLLGAPLGLAYALQGLTALAALAALFGLGRRVFRGPAEAAAAVSAGLIASPFLLDYDLALIAIPLAWLQREGRRTGFLAWEKTGMLAAFLLPLASRVVAGAVGLPLGPPAIAALFALTIRRGLTPEVVAAAPSDVVA